MSRKNHPGDELRGKSQVIGVFKAKRFSKIHFFTLLPLWSMDDYEGDRRCDLEKVTHSPPSPRTFGFHSTEPKGEK